MPEATVDGNEYFFEPRGPGFLVVFGHSLLFDRHMWDHQVEALSFRYRCIAYDFLGHGGSAVGARTSPPRLTRRSGSRRGSAARGWRR